MQSMSLFMFCCFDVESGKPVMSVVGLNELEHQHAEGLVCAIEAELLKVGIELTDTPELNNTECKMVCICLDGAASNMGKYRSVKALLQKRYPWVIVVHCINHNLELAIGDLRKHDPDYLFFDETMRDIFSVFHFSNKKRREIQAVADEMEEEFTNFSGLQTIRWLASQFRAVEKVYDNYYVLCTYLAHACVAPDKKPEDKAKMKGIYQRATSLKFVLYLNFMMDFLQPLKIGFLMFQDDDVLLPVLSRKLQGISEVMKFFL